jgi:hypothetical protein
MRKPAQGDVNSPLKCFKKSIHGESLGSDVGALSVKSHVESREPMYFLIPLKKGQTRCIKK